MGGGRLVGYIRYLGVYMRYFVGYIRYIVGYIRYLSSVTYVTSSRARSCRTRELTPRPRTRKSAERRWRTLSWRRLKILACSRERFSPVTVGNVCNGHAEVSSERAGCRERK